MNTLVRLDHCASTNSEILNFLNSNTYRILGVYTHNQTQGRGQYGNRWQSEPGQNLALSIAVPCESYKSSSMVFNFHTAVLCRAFIAKLTETLVEIKWPNDLIIRNKKISGMLVEKIKHNQKEYYIFGVGINIMQKNFDGLSSAGSLFTQTGLSLELHVVAQQLYDFLVENLMVENISDVLAEFNQFLYRKKKISVFEIQNSRQNGIIQSVDSEGYLWVDLENDGLKKFTYKELKLLY